MSMLDEFNEDERLLVFRYNQVNNRVSCSSCGSIVLYYDSFCYNCGSKLDEIKFVAPVSKKSSVDSELSMRYAAVALLDELVFNPLLSDFDNSFFNYFDGVDFYDVRNYLIDNDFVEVLYGEDKILACLDMVNDEFIEYVIKEHHLLLGKSRDDNVKIILENLSGEEMDKLFDDYYKVTDKGLSFFKENNYALFYSSFFSDCDLEYYENFYNGSSKDLNEFLLSLIDDSFEDSISALRWKSYSKLLHKYALVYYLKKDYEEMLYYLLSHLICEINPFADNHLKNEINISIYLKNILIRSIVRANLNYQSLTNLIKKAYSNIRLPKSYVKLEDVVLLVEELFDTNTKLREVNNHLTSIYGIEKICIDKSFYNKEEERKVMEEFDRLIK